MSLGSLGGYWNGANLMYYLGVFIVKSLATNCFIAIASSSLQKVLSF